MLKQLNVKNFALIQHAHLNFEEGYTVITGETGSGKSILLNALNLLLGERADFKVIGNKSDKAIVEAVFEVDETEFFNENDIDFESNTIIRREITKQGKSRAFINDSPVQLSILKSFSEKLISIHSQYNTLELKQKDFQLQTLDILAGTNEKRISFTKLFERSKGLAKNLAEEKKTLENLEKDRDYNEFQLNELEALSLTKTNYSEIENQLHKINNATEILQLNDTITKGLNTENGIIDNLITLKSIATKLSKLDDANKIIEDRISSVIIELKDLDNEIIQTIEKFEVFDEQQKEYLTDQIDKYNRLLIKHKYTSQEELIALQTELQNSFSSTEELQTKIIQLEKELSQLNNELLEKANDLHSERQNAIAEIEQEIKQLLTELKLPNTNLIFKLEKQEQLTSVGNSILTLLFSANKGVEPIAIEKAASGGELSRVMLALQKLISEKSKLPTIFFDEIDTGVSGDVAQKMGNLLQQMGNTMQLFAISHLPQVAAKANHHFKVEKSDESSSVSSTIVALNNEERINEIARLMSGEIINDAAISNAKALMA